MSALRHGAIAGALALCVPLAGVAGFLTWRSEESPLLPELQPGYIFADREEASQVVYEKGPGCWTVDRVPDGYVISDCGAHQKVVVTDISEDSEEAVASAERATSRGNPTCVAPTDDGRWATYLC